MNKVERRGTVKYDDLMRELEGFEQELLTENRAMAMDLMVLEAKIRERFQEMENRMWNNYATLPFENTPAFDEDFSMAEIEAMIPRDLSFFPTEAEMAEGRRRKQTLRTLVLAAALAVLTAAGVFGLASFLQIIIS